MPRTAGISTPKYRLHKKTGQAIVTIAGRDHYLGQHGSKPSRAEYRRLVREWVVAGRPNIVATVNSVTIAEVLLQFRQWAEQRYRRDGKPTGEADNLGCAMRPLRELYGDTRAIDFTPLSLETVQQHMIDAGLCRNVVNQRIQKIKRMFRWAVARQLIPPSVRDAVSAVLPIELGRDGVKETNPVKPVDDSVVEATLPWLPVVVADMVRLQRLTGCRPGEVCQLRPCDVDTSGEIWRFEPAQHKTRHRGHQRIILIGPKAQDILRPYLLRAHDAYCFTPEDAERKRLESRHAARKTPSSFGNVPGSNRVPNRKRKPGAAYCPRPYQHAITRAINRANRARLAEAKAAGIEADQVAIVRHWHPHRLRHSAGTELRARYGMDCAAIALGHRDLRTTLRYAEPDLRIAATAMREIG